MWKVLKFVFYAYIIIIIRMFINRKFDEVYRYNGIIKKEFEVMIKFNCNELERCLFY